MFSRRADIFLGEPEFLLSCLTKCSKDAYNQASNKEGFVNLGTAVNRLCEDVIKERFDKVNSKHTIAKYIKNACSGRFVQP